MASKITRKAIEIAKRDLRACYASNGIFAGRGHFQQYWCRDSFFASLGASAIGDLSVVKKQLYFFLLNEKKNGKLPGLITPRGRPEYRPLLLSNPVDGNALFVIAFSDYLRRSGDKKFARENFAGVRKAMEWVEGHDWNHDMLIEEGLLANWADSLFKCWKVLYSNVCYCRALEEFAAIAGALGEKALAGRYEKKAAGVKKEINRQFWLQEYYADWIDWKRHENFSSDGNVLAIVWGIADGEKGARIEEFVAEKKLTEVPMRTCYPNYAPWRVATFFTFPSKAFYYHNGLSWPWLGAMNAIALQRLGERKRAGKEMERIAELIVGQGTVHEIFDESGKPVRSALLKSEHPFAWSAALFLLAAEKTGIPREKAGE